MTLSAPRLLAPLTLIAGLVFAAPAAAETVTETFRTGPIQVSGYEVKQNDFEFGIPKPKVDGYVTGMSVDVVDADGTPVSIKRLMLHHIVFLNFGRTVGDRRDGTCESFLGLDTKSVLPGVAERFYAAGEERAVMTVPPGYGYHSRGDDQWLMTWMIMNHRKQTDRAYIQYEVTYETTPQTPVTPYWLDVRNCKADPVFDAPGGGKPGSRFTTSDTWTAPQSGRLVSVGGHVHGGAHKLGLTQPGCGNRTLTDIKPAWGSRRHPFYTVKPILHEPGPIATSGVLSSQGYPVAKGEQVRLSAIYDNERPHTRAMGIAIAYLAPDSAVTTPCAPLPTDVTEYQTELPHRTRPPRFTVPLTGLDRRGRAVTIARPPGKVRSMPRGGTIRVKDFRFSRPNVVVRPGARLRWRFDDPELHNITIADGPRGFSSPHLSDGRSYSKRLRAKGTYKLFCGLHPVSMTETVKVR